MLKTEMRNPKTMHIDQMTTLEMVSVIAEENYVAVRAVEAEKENIALAVDAIAASFANGGRLFFIGAGTSGRLGVLDASECPPTFGVDRSMVTGIIAGGRECMFAAGEGAEDRADNGAADVVAHGLSRGDVLVGVSVAGGAAYVVGAMQKAHELGAVTVALTCNPDTPIEKESDICICTDTGPEVITGSTRMKAGTAHKMVMNILTTCAMVKNGKVYENMMVNLRPMNIKLKDRMVRITADICHCTKEEAYAKLEANEWNIRKAAGVKE
ncbi:MAG: N-acetylmuramic acid 6-phosphate etherase [Clostridia bacterium]|nr:N-acetylmuramic acid 6-phosphate etherase [Clostridia bacterium]